MGARMGNVALLQMKAIRNAEPPLCSAFRNQPGSSAFSSSISCSAHASAAPSDKPPSVLTTLQAVYSPWHAASMNYVNQNVGELDHIFWVRAPLH